MANKYAERDFEKERREWKPLPETDMPDGVAPPPRNYAAQLTVRCNLKCKMCGQWGETGMHRYRHDHPWLQEMSVSQWQVIIDQIAEIGAGIGFWGGEPLVYKDAAEVIVYAKSKGVTTAIITNGVLLEKHAEIIACYRQIGTDWS